MKIRFHKNHLRLRLSQSEVADLAQGKQLFESFEFGNAARLSFRIESGAERAALYENDQIRVRAPLEEIAGWSASDREGLEFDDGRLKIAIEKDYECLHKPSAEGVDVFPNPMADRL
jgi:hypothetical protein